MERRNAGLGKDISVTESTEISGISCGIDGSGIAARYHTGGSAEAGSAVCGADGTAAGSLVSGLAPKLSVGRAAYLAACERTTSERHACATGFSETSLAGLFHAATALSIGGIVAGEEPPTEPTYGDFTVRNMKDLQISAFGGDICTAVSVRFAYDWARGEYKKALLLEAPELVERYGRTTRTFELKWLKSSRQAYLTGVRLLGYLSRPRWAISFTDGVVSASIPPGVWVTVAHPHVPVSGRMLTLNGELDPSAASVRITVEAIAGDTPEIALAKLSEAYATQLPDGISVTYAAGFATFTIVDVDGSSIVGAKVTLDGDLTLSTDSFGKVSFQTARGVHHLKIMATGYVTQELDVTV